MRTVCLVAGIVVVTAVASAGAGQKPAQKPAGKTVKDGVFTAAQATRGEALYKKQCASCHAPDLTGGQAPPLAGADFLTFWDKTPLSDLVAKIQQSMPQATPGSLSPQQVADVTAYMLRVNKFPAGKTPLPSTADAQKTIRIVK